jgi:hypothetical protein
MPRGRPVEEVEFDPGDSAGVAERMDQLAAAGDGWINLLPGVPEDEVEMPTRSVFSALFGTAQAPVSMCTWMPPVARRGRDVQTIGIMHPRGRRAVSQLASMGVTVPPAWQVRQDHARRGLILYAPASAPHAEVLSWMLRAGAALALVSLTGRWQARVFLPR